MSSLSIFNKSWIDIGWKLFSKYVSNIVTVKDLSRKPITDIKYKITSGKLTKTVCSTVLLKNKSVNENIEYWKIRIKT